MEITPTPDQQALIRLAIETGHLSRPEDAVMEAMALWEERERTRLELRAVLDDAEASLERGGGREITQAAMLELAADVKARGRTKLLAERSTVG